MTDPLFVVRLVKGGSEREVHYNGVYVGRIHGGDFRSCGTRWYTPKLLALILEYIAEHPAGSIPEQWSFESIDDVIHIHDGEFMAIFEFPEEASQRPWRDCIVLMDGTPTKLAHILELKDDTRVVARCKYVEMTND